MTINLTKSDIFFVFALLCTNGSAMSREQHLSSKSPRGPNGNDVLLFARNTDVTNGGTPKLVPMEIIEMQHSILNHSKGSHKSQKTSSNGRQLSSQIQIDPSLLDSPYGAANVPRLDLDSNRLSGNAGVSTLRGCRARCPDAPRRLYTEETPRSIAGNISSRSHISNPLVAVSTLALDQRC